MKKLILLAVIFSSCSLGYKIDTTYEKEKELYENTIYVIVDKVEKRKIFCHWKDEYMIPAFNLKKPVSVGDTMHLNNTINPTQIYIIYEWNKK